MTVTELKTGQNYWHARAEVAEVERDKLFRQNAELTTQRDALLGKEDAVHLGAQAAVSAILQME